MPPARKKAGPEMLDTSRSRLGLLVCSAILLATFAGGIPASCSAGECLTATDEIATDRPNFTNSSLVVPLGSLQVENGLNWTVRHGANALDGPNTRVRLGVARCTEFLLDLPNYFGSVTGSQPSGFSDLVLSFKRQLPVPFGFAMVATAGLGFPSGSSNISGRGYQPYIQFPWSHEIADGWGVAGMFTVSWFPSESLRDPTFEPTFALTKSFSPSTDMLLEYVGDYDHQRPTQILDTGGTWRFATRQQLDFQVGMGLNSSSVDHYFGLGYSFRFDDLFAGPAATSP